MKKKNEEIFIAPDLFYVIGADFSLNRPGFSIVKVETGIITGIITESVDNKTKKENKTRGQLLVEIADKLEEICKDSKENSFFVREASVNNALFGRRSGTAARTGISEVVGISDLILWKTKTKSWNEIYPSTIKKLVSGYGKATKEEVADSLYDYVGEHEYLNDDESDATAVAVAWLIQQNVISPINKYQKLPK